MINTDQCDGIANTEVDEHVDPRLSGVRLDIGEAVVECIAGEIKNIGIVPPRNSIWALITRILCPRVSGGEQIRWQDREILR